jgi:DnaK suppressor protein
VELADLRKRLLAMRSAIESMFDTPDNVDEVVELDQTRVGRLSRMDAMQLQAMAKAGQARAKVELGRIDAALRRLDGGTYGECLDCGEAIAEGAWRPIRRRTGVWGVPRRVKGRSADHGNRHPGLQFSSSRPPSRDAPVEFYRRDVGPGSRRQRRRSGMTKWS